MEAERKIVQNAAFLGEHHDNKVLIVVMAQAPISPRPQNFGGREENHPKTLLFLEGAP